MTDRQDGDVVELWLVPDEPSAPASEELLAVLDPGERQRAGAYLSAEDRRRFVLAHGAVRHIVARRLGAPAAALAWARGPHGKPELTGRWRGPQVNLSHSGEVAMVAVTASRRVGVDVQRVLPRLDTGAMADRYYPSAEAEFVRAATGAAGRADRFARLWVRKEALVKAHGGRLTQGLRVPVPDSGPQGDGSPEDAWSHGYRVLDVPAPAGYRAAVALSGRAAYRVALRRWTWPLS